jgi:hypothetical protein
MNPCSPQTPQFAQNLSVKSFRQTARKTAMNGLSAAALGFNTLLEAVWQQPVIYPNAY